MADFTSYHINILLRIADFDLDQTYFRLGSLHRMTILIADKTLSNKVRKLSRLQEDFKKSHWDKVDKNITYFKSLKDKRKPITGMSKDSGNRLRALYKVYTLLLLGVLIARKGKPHDIREELIPAVKEVIQMVMHNIFNSTEHFHLSKKELMKWQVMYLLLCAKSSEQKH